MGTVISDVLIFSFTPLYPAYAQQAERVFALTPVRDQQLAGLVMTIDQLLTLGTCAAVLLWPALRRRAGAHKRIARRGADSHESGPYRFSFEPLFLVAALVARCPLCARRPALRPEDRPSSGRACCVRARARADRASAQLAARDDSRPHSLLLAHLLQNALIADWGPPS